MNEEMEKRLKLFGFHHEPFLGTPRAPYLEGGRAELLHRLREFVHRRGFAALTGGPGLGKTLLAFQLSSELNPNTHRVIYVPDGDYKPADMLRAIAGGLDLEGGVGRSRQSRKIAARLSEMKGVTPLLVLDEAQKLSHESLECVRMLSSHQLDGRNLFAVLLLGTEELIDRLALRINEPFRQRLGLYLRVEPLSRAETRSYLAHRLASAGVKAELFGGEALNLLFDLTNGIPRQIDKLATASLDEAAEEKCPVVGLAHIQTAAERVFPRRAEAKQ